MHLAYFYQELVGVVLLVGKDPIVTYLYVLENPNVTIKHVLVRQILQLVTVLRCGVDILVLFLNALTIATTMEVAMHQVELQNACVKMVGHLLIVLKESVPEFLLVPTEEAVEQMFLLQNVSVNLIGVVQVVKLQLLRVNVQITVVHMVLVTQIMELVHVT